MQTACFIITGNDNCRALMPKLQGLNIVLGLSGIGHDYLQYLAANIAIYGPLFLGGFALISSHFEKGIRISQI